MEAKNGLNEAVTAAEDRVKALRERSMGLGLGDNIPSPANPERFEEEEVVAEEVVIDAPVANKKSNTPLIIGGVALLAVVAFVVLRKRK